MLQIVYASAATVPFTPRDLTTLLARARSRNSLYQVTGLLLYDAGSFLQVLEGPEAGVDFIFHAIERDARHHATRVLLRHTVQTREFEMWSMGFKDVSPADRQPGQLDFARSLPKLIDAPTRACQYLRFFRDGLCRQAVPA